MFEKNLKFAYLLDFYGSLLDEHTEAVMKAYYDDDLSLAEVAVGVGISRQGVRHVIKRGEERLEYFEEKLALMKKHSELLDASERLAAIRDEVALSYPGNSDLVERLNGVIQEIIPKN